MSVGAEFVEDCARMASAAKRGVGIDAVGAHLQSVHNFGQ